MTDAEDNDSSTALMSVTSTPIPLSYRGTENRSSRDGETSGVSHSAEDTAQSQADDLEELKYGAKHATKLFPPITLTMVVVIVTIKLVYSNKLSSGEIVGAATSQYLAEEGGSQYLTSLYTVLVLLGVIALMTFVLVLLYKFRVYFILYGWIFLSTVMIFFVLTFMYTFNFVEAFNLAVDVVSVGFVLLNVGTVGMLSVHLAVPLPLRQFYLVGMSALMTCIFINALPAITTWMALAMLVIWDLVAVLCPFGPLKHLIEIAQQREENDDHDMGFLKAILYSTTMVYMVDEETGRPAGNGVETAEDQGAVSPTPTAVSPSAVAVSPSAVAVSPSPEGTSQAAGRAEADRRSSGESRPAQRSRREADRGVKLGLGDFVFYSLLIGRASYDSDLSTTVACFVAILVGLCFTLLLLAIFRKALPALPISITLGLIFYFASDILIAPFLATTSSQYVFI